MKRLLVFLSRPLLAFWLLIASGTVIFWGAIVARLNDTALKGLNDTLMQDWLVVYGSRPGLYIWILILFVLLTLLALNTCVCTLPYVVQTLRVDSPHRRLTVILFHICILIFLLGHLLSTFAGTNAVLTLKPGEQTHIPAAGIALKLIGAERSTKALNNDGLPLATAAVVEVVAPGGREIKHLHAFRPAFAQGLSLHIALKEKGVPFGAVQIIARRDYGAYVLMLGACLAMLATLFYAIIAWKARESRPRLGENS